MSRDGLMAYSRQRIDFDIWGVEIDANRGEKRGEPTRVTQGTAWDQFASVDADGSALVFMSDRSGNEDVWMKDLKSAKEPRQLTFTPENEWRALISPDGLTVAFARDPTERLRSISCRWQAESKKRSWMTRLASSVGHPTARRCSTLGVSLFVLRWSTSKPARSRTLFLSRNTRFTIPSTRLMIGWLSFTVVEGPEDAPIYIAPLLEESVAEQSEWIQITKGPLAAVGGRKLVVP